MKTYKIYMHKNKINGKIYVGQTYQVPQERWGCQGKGYRNCTKFYNAIQKYGWDNFEHIIIEEVYAPEEADKREQYWINYYNSVEDGYNLSYGGNGLHSFSSEHRANLRQSIVDAIGRKVVCINTKKVYETLFEAEQDTGATHIGDCCKGKVLTSGRDKNGNGLVWRYFEDYDENEKITIKPQKRTKTKVLCIETNKIYNSAKEAERETGVDSTSIGRCCNGIRKSAVKCHWQWVE